MFLFPILPVFSSFFVMLNGHEPSHYKWFNMDSNRKKQVKELATQREKHIQWKFISIWFCISFFGENALVFYHILAHNNSVDYQIDGGITAIYVYSSYRYIHTYFCTKGISIAICGQNKILDRMPLQNITKYLFV